MQVVKIAVIGRLPTMDQPRLPRYHRNARYCGSLGWHDERERFRRSSCPAVREDGPEFFAKPSKRLHVLRPACRKVRYDGQFHQAKLRSPGYTWDGVSQSA